MTVHPDDTLSGIAATHGIDDWHEIWPQNQDRPEPGGRHFTDPNLILPGWTIELPGHAATAPPTAHPAHPPVTSHTGTEHPGTEHPGTEHPGTQHRPPPGRRPDCTPCPRCQSTTRRPR